MIRELVAVAAAKWLWYHAREVSSTGDARKGDRHFHRWYGDRNNLGVAWGITFGSRMPIRPSVSIDYEDKTLELYIDEGATTLLGVLENVRLVCLLPGNQCAVRRLDLGRMRRAIGTEADAIVEQILSRLGVHLDRPS